MDASTPPGGPHADAEARGVASPLTKRGTFRRAADAVADDAKFTRYALDPDAAHGKARVFAAALGFDVDNWRLLREQIMAGVREAPAVPGAIDEHGSRYTVDVPVVGLDGRTATVRTRWILRDPEDAPRLVTLFVL